MKPTELLLALRVLSELIALLDRAIRTGQSEVSVDELSEAFERANAAEANWQAALQKPVPQAPEGTGHDYRERAAPDHGPIAGPQKDLLDAARHPGLGNSDHLRRRDPRVHLGGPGCAGARVPAGGSQ